MHEARPTEYRDNKFRSKTEAVFARLVDISGGANGWAYEPPQWRVGSYVPDFMLVMPGKRYVLVEVKPAPPTPTYILEFQSRMERLCTSGIKNKPTVAILLGFNPFKPWIKIVEMCSNFPKHECPECGHSPDMSWLNNWVDASHIEDAVKYRFDLKHEAGH